MLVTAMAATALPAPPLAVPPGGELSRAALLADLRAASRVPLRADPDPVSGYVTTIAGRFDTDGLRGEAAARAFLQRYADLFSLDPDLRDLTPARRTDDRGGVVAAYRQELRGIPVIGGMVVVGLNPDGSILHVRNEHVPGLDLDTTPSVSREEAIAAAESTLGARLSEPRLTVRLAIAEGDKEHPGYHLSWEVASFLRAPLGDWRVYVDARTVEVIRIANDLKQAGAPCIPCDPATDFQCGRVFHDDPVSFLDNPSLRDTTNVDAAQQGCKLSHLTSATALTGSYANTTITSSRISPPYSALRSASQPAVDEVNTYYHLDRAKGHLDSLGFPLVVNFSINADAHDAALGDNSHYVPSGDYLEFGTGGVDDAQDPDIVYHEYGHAIQDNQVPGWGGSPEAGAMGEGFGDYWAAAITDDSFATALGPACVGAWDATSYNPYQAGVLGSGCLRRTDSSKLWPQQFEWQVHADGEIWSSALWELRGFLGGPVADALVIKAHTFMTPGATFLSAADALLAADAALNGGANAAAVNATMAAHGIPRTGTPVSSTGLNLTASYFCESNHNYVGGEYRECRFTQPGASRVRLHFSRLVTENGFDFIYISDGDYNQVQVMTGAPFGMNGGGFSTVVRGDTIVARFKADPSLNKYGFIIDWAEYSIGSGRVGDGSSGAPGDTGLTIEQAAFGDLILSWGPSCSSGDDDYGVYEGVLGDFTSHVPIVCHTGGLTTLMIAPAAVSTYYLIVPNNPAVEGSYGLRSDGAERPPSASPCRPQAITAVCQ